MAKKYEFRPDKTGPGFLDKLYLTPQQRKRILKWLLYALMLLTLSVLQDVILCRLRVMDASTDLVPCGIILVCLMEGAESGSVFALVASFLFLFSGSAPGFYTVPLLTALAVGVTILRQSFLRKGFSAALLCMALALVAYELCLYVVGLVLELTHPGRIIGFCLTALMSWATVPALYPLARAIGNIGGETWKE